MTSHLQEPALNALRECCSHVQFQRMGGAEPVSEELKRQALSSADIALSLVDNTQETFGLAVAEAMAAGLPVVASNWNGYRDLVRHGVDGYLVPTRWATTAQRCQHAWVGSSLLGLNHFQLWLELWLSWFNLIMMLQKRPVSLVDQRFAPSSDGAVCYGSSKRIV